MLLGNKILVWNIRTAGSIGTVKRRQGISARLIPLIPGVSALMSQRTSVPSLIRNSGIAGNVLGIKK